MTTVSLCNGHNVFSLRNRREKFDIIKSYLDIQVSHLNSHDCADIKLMTKIGNNVVYLTCLCSYNCRLFNSLELHLWEFKV